MLPFVRAGDILLVRRENPFRLSRGDVLLYARGERLYAHRLVAKRWQGHQLLLQAKGDALPEVDPPFAAKELMGQVVAVWRGRRQINPASLLHRLVAQAVSCLPAGYLGVRLLLRLGRQLSSQRRW